MVGTPNHIAIAIQRQRLEAGAHRYPLTANVAVNRFSMDTE